MAHDSGTSTELYRQRVALTSAPQLPFGQPCTRNDGIDQQSWVSGRRFKGQSRHRCREVEKHSPGDAGVALGGRQASQFDTKLMCALDYKVLMGGFVDAILPERGARITVALSGQAKETYEF